MGFRGEFPVKMCGTIWLFRFYLSGGFKTAQNLSLKISINLPVFLATAHLVLFYFLRGFCFFTFCLPYLNNVMENPCPAYL